MSNRDNGLPPIADGKHDPNGGPQGRWTITFKLEPGETLVGPADVIAVAPNRSDLPLTDTLQISAIALGQVSEVPNVWGISFTTEGGTAQIYWLRGSAQRSDGTHTYGAQRTVRMQSKNG